MKPTDVHPGTLYAFIRESNLIERIDRPVNDTELAAHQRLLALERITVADVEGFVRVVASAGLRRNPGQNIVITGARHRPPPGGPEIEHYLADLLRHARAPGADPYATHVEYETLHPFTDGNGRSGRALWLWMVLREGRIRDPFGMPFLQRWYYDSLEAAR